MVRKKYIKIEEEKENKRRDERRPRKEKWWKEEEKLKIQNLYTEDHPNVEIQSKRLIIYGGDKRQTNRLIDTNPNHFFIFLAICLLRISSLRSISRRASSQTSAVISSESLPDDEEDELEDPNRSPTGEIGLFRECCCRGWDCASKGFLSASIASAVSKSGSSSSLIIELF